MNENLRFGKQIVKVTRFQAKSLQKYFFIGALFYLRRKQAAALLNIRPAYRYFEAGIAFPFVYRFEILSFQVAEKRFEDSIYSNTKLTTSTRAT